MYVALLFVKSKVCERGYNVWGMYEYMLVAIDLPAWGYLGCGCLGSAMLMIINRISITI